MRKWLTNQELLRLIEHSESSSLPKRTFCKLNELNPSTFYAKRQQLLYSRQSQTGGSIKVEVVEEMTRDQVTHSPVAQLCRGYGMGNSTLYKWRAKHGGIDASLMAKMKVLEEGNRQLEKMYAEE